MNGTIEIDLCEGRVTVGATSLPCSSAGPNGALRLGGERGPVLREVTFAERSAVVARAAHDRAPCDAVAAGLLVTALLEPPADGWARDDETFAEVVTLALAGGQSDGPPFEETRRAAARAGLALSGIDGAPATDIDDLVACLSRPVDHGLDAGQTVVRRFVLVDEPRQTVSAMRAEMAERLLRRGAADGEPKESAGGEESAAAGSGRTHDGGMRGEARVPPVGSGRREPTPAVVSAVKSRFEIVPSLEPVRPAEPRIAPEILPVASSAEVPTDSAAPRPTDPASSVGGEPPVKAREPDRVVAAPHVSVPRRWPPTAREALSVVRRGSPAPRAVALRRLGLGAAAGTIAAARPDPGLARGAAIDRSPRAAAVASEPIEPRASRAPGSDASVSGAPAGAPPAHVVATPSSSSIADALAALLDAEADLRGID